MIAQEGEWKQTAVARQLIAFGRLKLGLAIASVITFSSRKTTNRLRAIETAVYRFRPGAPGNVARQLIAFGRLKPLSDVHAVFAQVVSQDN